jgi:hypothetical protein
VAARHDAYVLGGRVEGWKEVTRLRAAVSTKQKKDVSYSIVVFLSTHSLPSYQQVGWAGGRLSLCLLWLDSLF